MLEIAGNAGNCWQRWKLLATLEIAGNAGNCWQRWKLLATLEKKWVTHFPAFHQSGSRVGRLSWKWVSPASAATAREFAIAGYAWIPTTPGLVRPMCAHFMAWHFQC